tara:strand:+ start:29 stop:295 length:267 start_codon:yes stop_codon:yes gene_type:complete
MIQIKYNGDKKRYDVKVPQEIAGDKSMIDVAYITENNRINILREVHISLLRTIMLHWDEYEFQITKENDLHGLMEDYLNKNLTDEKGE